ncbi:MAG: HEAT repeat domain-containing protein [Candidatus Riflebacteria bacterium]|nr:HEAT repeat domain-containing protein [Candidatus Riflebacteria bacterium]
MRLPNAGRALPDSRDPVVQAYFLRRLPMVSRDAIVRNLRGVLDLLKGFDAETAVAVLRDLDSQQAQGLGKLLLHILWEDPRPAVCGPALKLLAVQPEQSEILPELMRLRRHLHEPRAVSALVAALGLVGRELPFKLFKPYLAHPDARVRANTIEALLDRLHPRLTDVMAAMVNDPEPRVRALAALALWRLGRPLLVELLAETESPQARIAFAHAAGRVGQDPRLAEVLLGVAGNGALDPKLRRMAADSLASVGAAADLSRMIGSAFKVSQPELRRTLVASAVAIDPEGASSYLIRILERLSATTRHRQLASTLAFLGALPVQPPPEQLQPYLEHPDPRVAANTVETLAQHATLPSVASSLVRSLSHPASRVAANAALALWKLGFVRAFGRLQEMASECSAGARASAAWAFGRIGGLLAQDAARPLLQDPEENVRRWAFEALK